MKSEVLSLEGNTDSNCSMLTEVNSFPKYGATGGLLDDGTILVCGGAYGNFTASWELPPESWECLLYSKSDRPRMISMENGRENSASIVIGAKLFVAGGKYLSTNANDYFYM